ncbi:2-hydroxy-3-keto-5-methylthiopentenyl-1-phosphate phosphatase [Bacillus sp. H-16]|uniref:2-hydroxy-3-keto-5-methylthiopentenyl-1- phosphate phosphatase n=1 Tax=Alteribacter salitolerans TaxID=2912333 RepID=UPI001966BC26|nr:2-hydroxy-3-keto-5-methylthiopentenyl-1-phosphate phosphatase [Alteribacter salitolerans]MBM7095633.1 2-hydroxy-3-keto-5-methylthiopentenyl-1-phosphate phosphatase [Alteribacter salitolerans]
MKRKPIVFCDFDGTITVKDNIITIMKEFAPPEWKAIKDDIFEERISLREGVGRMFSLIPSAKKIEIVNYVLEQAEMRKGFTEFLAFARNRGIRIRVVSGGIDFFIEPLLEPYKLLDQLFCNGSDFSGDTIRITWPHACDEGCDKDCGCCKASILRQFPDDEYYKIVIGDSISNLEAAKEAHQVFACDDFLLEKCREFGLNHTSFTTFYDVISQIEQQREIAGRR